jgi:hypothetical protein
MVPGMVAHHQSVVNGTSVQVYFQPLLVPIYRVLWA